jgi:hypothetical protein
VRDIQSEQYNFSREGGNVGRDVSNPHPLQFNFIREDGNVGSDVSDVHYFVKIIHISI